jgi:HAD superfamily hydrolase (TIGR01490 family)
VRAAFFDIDGTLTKDRTWKGFLDYFNYHRKRRITHVAFLVAHYPLYFLYRLGIISAGTFRGNWAADMPWYIRGYSIEQAEAVWDWCVTRYLNQQWREDSLAILNAHLNAGEPVVLVSSGPLPLVQRIGKELGTDLAVGTVLEVKDNKYTGRSLPPICIDESKARLAKSHLNHMNYSVDYDQSYAYADSITDLHLLSMVGNPTAVYPEQQLRSLAIERGWQIFPQSLVDQRASA